MRRVLPWLLAFAVLLGLSNFCWAQKESKPFLTVSFSGYDELMKDVELIGKLANFPGLSKMLEQQAEAQDPGKLLGSLDKKKPWGLVAKLNAQSQPVVEGFVPIGGLKELLKALEPMVEATDAGDGAYEIKAGPRSIFLKQMGSWTIVGSSKEALADVPEDPVKLLDGLNEKYNLAVSFAVKNIPAATRDMFMFPITMAFQAGMRRMPNETDEQFQLRSKVGQQAIQQLTETIKDLDTVLLGLVVDEKTSSARLDVVTTVLPGTKSAQKLAKAADKTEFAGFLDPDAAVTLNLTQKADESDIAQFKSQFGVVRSNMLAELDKQGLPEEQLKQAKQLAGDLMDVLEKSIEGGRFDGGLMFKAGAKNLQLVAGFRVAEGAKLEKTLKQLVEQIGKEEPDAAKLFKFNAEEHQGVRFHAISFPMDQIPDEEAKQKIGQLMGDKLEAIIGIGDNAVYFAAGRDAAKTLKEAIDKSKSAGSTSVPPMQLSIALGPIAQLVAAVGDGNVKQAAEMVAKLLSPAAGKDHIKLTSTLIPNGTKVQLELEEGVLRLLGAIPLMRAGQLSPQ